MARSHRWPAPLRDGSRSSSQCGCATRRPGRIARAAPILTPLLTPPGTLRWAGPVTAPEPSGSATIQGRYRRVRETPTLGANLDAPVAHRPTRGRYALARPLAAPCCASGSSAPTRAVAVAKLDDSDRVCHAEQPHIRKAIKHQISATLH